MRISNLRSCIILTALTCAFLATLSRPAIAQYEGATLKDEPMIGIELKNPRVREFARERDKMASDIAHQIGFYPIVSGDYGKEVSILFPLGRSDRAYALFLPWPDITLSASGKEILCCYQRVHGTAKLVYKINLLLADPTKKSKFSGSVVSLLTYLMPITASSLWDAKNKSVPTVYDMSASTTSAELKDLAIKREYVEYYTEVPVNGVYVSLLSKDDVTSPDGFYDYDNDTDPAVKRLNPVALARLRPYGFDFRKKYGLPPAFAELKGWGFGDGVQMTGI